MKRFKIIAILMIAVLILAGCNDEPNSTENPIDTVEWRYEIRKGDTLYGLAEYFAADVTVSPEKWVDWVMKKNGIRNHIEAGKKIIILTTKSEYTTYAFLGPSDYFKLKNGEDTARIEKVLAKRNSPRTELTYTIVWGDTLSGLGKVFGTGIGMTIPDWTKWVVEHNHLKSKEYIKAGQLIQILASEEDASLYQKLGHDQFFNCKHAEY